MVSTLLFYPLERPPNGRPKSFQYMLPVCVHILICLNRVSALADLAGG